MTSQPYSDRTAFHPDPRDGVHLWFLSLTGIDSHYVRSFYESAELLIQTLLCGGERKPSDRIILPICYLFRHYLELQCKYLIETVGVLHNSQRPKPLQGHNLRDLWDETRRLVEPEFPAFTNVPFDSVQSIIYQIHDADPKGEDFRYPNTTKGLPTLQNIPLSFSAESLYESMQRARTFLDQWAWELDRRFDSP